MVKKAVAYETFSFLEINHSLLYSNMPINQKKRSNCNKILNSFVKISGNKGPQKS